MACTDYPQVTVIGITPAASPEVPHETIQLGELVLHILTHELSSQCSDVTAMTVPLGWYWQVSSRIGFLDLSCTRFTTYCVPACMCYWAGWSGLSLIEHGCKRNLRVEPSAPITLLAKDSAFSTSAIDSSWPSRGDTNRIESHVFPSI